jgi:hypothetical protein
VVLFETDPGQQMQADSTCPVSVDGFPSSDLGLSFTSLDLTPQGGLMPQASEAPDSYSTPPCGDADVRARS